MCVPTPPTPNREPDLGPLIDSTQALAEVPQADQLVVLESTTHPGTTRERVVPILEQSGLAAGRDFHVAFSPERMSIDIWEVVDAAATKPYGFMRLQPGPGMGGHCPLVGDIRESPALKILTLLSALGAELRYHDPSRSRAQVDIASRRYRGAPTGNQARGLHGAPRRGKEAPPPQAPGPATACADAHQNHATHTRDK